MPWPKKKCSIEGCEGFSCTRGWCKRHYKKWFLYGDPLKGHIKTKEELEKIGSGHLKKEGYRIMSVNGKEKYEHTLKAEMILGKKLPPGAVIHHVDEKRSNNKTSNFVICESNTYHLFLHTRKRALDACGHANWKKCTYCQQYDDPKNMYNHYKRYVGFHRKCHNEYEKESRRKRKEIRIALA